MQAELVAGQMQSSSPGHGFKGCHLPAGVIESLFDRLKTVGALQPGLDLGSLAGRGQLHHRSPSHAVCQDATACSASQLRGERDGAVGQTQCTLQHEPEQGQHIK